MFLVRELWCATKRVPKCVNSDTRGTTQDKQVECRSGSGGQKGSSESKLLGLLGSNQFSTKCLGVYEEAFAKYLNLKTGPQAFRSYEVAI